MLLLSLKRFLSISNSSAVGYSMTLGYILSPVVTIKSKSSGEFYLAFCLMELIPLNTKFA
jgi:hypothetical protein